MLLYVSTQNSGNISRPQLNIYTRIYVPIGMSTIFFLSLLLFPPSALLKIPT
jgi:hypothetical protein